MRAHADPHSPRDGLPGGAGASGGDDVDDVASVLRTPGGAGAAPAQRERRYAGPSISYAGPQRATAAEGVRERACKAIVCWYHPDTETPITRCYAPRPNGRRSLGWTGGAWTTGRRGSAPRISSAYGVASFPCRPELRGHRERSARTLVRPSKRPTVQQPSAPSIRLRRVALWMGSGLPCCCNWACMHVIV